MFELEIKRLNFGKRFRGLKIVQISDLHICKMNLGLLNEVKEKINSVYADIVIITGDFICNGGECLKELEYLLKGINAKVAKYACMGNHDYADTDCGQKITKVLTKSDFKLLKNNREDLFFNFYSLGFSGLDDPENGKVNYSHIQKGDIVLSHNPITFGEALKYSPSLMMSGHTHGGQIKLGILHLLYNKITGYDYIEGLYKKNQSLLYVNRGIGNVVFKPKFWDKEITINTPRINSSSEITLFEFV
jgi:predicted MPP superfamily phosphohydrolase